MKNKGWLKSTDIAKGLNLSIGTVTRCLRTLIREGDVYHIEEDGKKNRNRYIIKEELMKEMEEK